MGQIRRTAEQWLELVAEFEASGQSGKDFCTERGLCASHFYKKRRHMRRQAFAPVRVAAAATTPDPITIELRGMTIRCTSDTPAAWLAEVIGAVRR